MTTPIRDDDGDIDVPARASTLKTRANTTLQTARLIHWIIPVCKAIWDTKADVKKIKFQSQYI